MSTLLGILFTVISLMPNLNYDIENIVKLENQLYTITNKQKTVMKNSLKKGSLTLTAIAWQESSFGVKVINSTDGIKGSYCIYQVQSAIAAKRYNISVKEAKNKLLNDRDFCRKAAMDELEFWATRKDSNYKKMLSGYNAGYKGLKYSDTKYSKEVREKVLALSLHIIKNNIEL